MNPNFYNVWSSRIRSDSYPATMFLLVFTIIIILLTLLMKWWNCPLYILSRLKSNFVFIIRHPTYFYISLIREALGYSATSKISPWKRLLFLYSETDWFRSYTSLYNYAILYPFDLCIFYNSSFSRLITPFLSCYADIWLS
jgi:hypothetical protein